MRYGSVCSGIEAATAAWHPLGWEPAWFAEIEPFPSAVLAHHYPQVPNLGDMTTIAARILAGEVEAPDVLVGGTPCQAFSVAGLRRSLDDDRGNLALAFVRLAAAVDSVRAAAGKPPAWILWENVPGVLSVRDNAFGCFLGGLVGADAPLVPDRKWRGAGVAAGPSRVAAWRTLDAQFFGVAQRRRRVFVLARGGAGAWGAPDALLPLTQGLRWHPAPRREAGPEAAGGAGAGAAFGGGSDGADPRGGSGGADGGRARPGAGRRGPLTLEVAGPLTRSVPGERGTEGAELGHLIIPSVAGPPGAHASGGWDPGDHERNGALIPIPFDTTQVTSRENRSRPEPGSPCHPLAAGGHPLAAGGHPPALAFEPFVFANTAGDTALGLGRPGVPPLTRRNGDPGNVVQPGMAVRRLTPRECERLQGFPDDYTLIPWKKGAAPDGPRYRALGNSMAVPVMGHIGLAIHRVNEG